MSRATRLRPTWSPRLQARRECGVHHMSRAQPHGSQRCDPSTQHPRPHAAKGCVSSTHDSRWGRRPEHGTSWPPDERPGSRSRIGILRQYRLRLPSEPGGSARENVALHFELAECPSWRNATANAFPAPVSRRSGRTVSYAARTAFDARLRGRRPPRYLPCHSSSSM
jgi:hypothetical protein